MTDPTREDYERAAHSISVNTGSVSRWIARCSCGWDTGEVTSREAAWRDSCGHLLASLTAAAERMTWRPIAEAPRGKCLLYYPEEFGRNAKAEMYMVDFHPVTYPRKPTHWLPLPPAPKG